MANFCFIFLLTLLITACSSHQAAPTKTLIDTTATPLTTPTPLAAPTYRPSTDSILGVYGNWCGLNHPKDIETADDPIDVLDASCRRHDLCYVDKGQFSCECDKIFNDELSNNLKNDVYQAQQQKYALMFYRYFKGSPCTGETSAKIAPTRLLENIYKGTKNRATSIYDRIIENNNSDAQTTGAEISDSTPSTPTKTK